MIPPCNLAFSDLCLPFFMYLKLKKKKHHHKKKPNNKTKPTTKKKTVFLKEAATMAKIISWMLFQLAAIN